VYLAIQKELYKNAEIRRAVNEIYEGQPRAGVAAVTTLADIRVQQAGHGRYMDRVATNQPRFACLDCLVVLNQSNHASVHYISNQSI
jgi:hypothetical protein